MDFVTEWQRKSTMIFPATGRPKGVELRVDLPYTVSKLIGNVQPPISAVKNQGSGILMIQAGYMYKRITEPEELNCRNVTRIYAVSNCISKNFAYYIPFWKHNQYWFFNAPEDMDGIIDQQKIIGDFELHAKVHEDGAPGPPRRQGGDRLDNNVGRLDVAVDDSLLVGVVQGRGQVLE